MPRRRKQPDGIPPIFLLFLIAPWYVGPILAMVAYTALRWVVPWLVPLPKPELKTATDAVQLVFGAFAQSASGVAPIAAAVIMFVWLLAELLKFLKRLSEGDIDWPRFGKHRAVTQSTVNQDPATFPQNPQQKHQTTSHRGELRDSVNDSDPNHSRASTHQPRWVAEVAPTSNAVQAEMAVHEIDISKMSWKEFEKLLVQVLRRFGFQAEHTGRNGPDGGIDVRCTNSKGENILVQCKHWHSQEVGVSVIREFFGVLTHERAARGIIVSSGLFTQEAKKFAENKALTLIDGEKLLKVLSEIPNEWQGRKIHYRISHLETRISPEPCPLCAGRMIRKSGRRGVFLSCERYPDCDGSRNA